MVSLLRPVLAALILTLWSCTTLAQEIDGWIGWEQRIFPQQGLSDEQKSSTGSQLLGLKFFTNWDEERQELTVDALYRQDPSDSNRDPVELRDLYWSLLSGQWELHAGYKKVFWGVTEFTHPVDILNQADLMDDPFGNEKLGQLMVNLTTVTGIGIFDLYLLPLFRDRVFPAANSRFRSELTVDTANPVYQKGSGRNHLDFALRSTHTIDKVDFSFSYFKGTERSPEFAPNQREDGSMVLQPRYGQMMQLGLELQWTLENLLVKYEGAYRKKSRHFSQLSDPAFFNYSGGIEYSFYRVFGSRSDLGFIAEYMKDSRGHQADTPFENDIFTGIRFAMNDEQDMEALAGVVWDLDKNSRVWTMNLKYRIGQSMTMELNAMLMDNIANKDLLYGLRKDSHLELEFLYYFGL